MPPVAARRRAKPGGFPPSVINRCNAFNLLLSLGIVFLVYRLCDYPTAEPAEGPSEPAGVEKLDLPRPALVDAKMWTEPLGKQLDPALIDVVTWPERPSDADCAFVASYGPGGTNSSRALLLRRGARAWPVTDRTSLRRLTKKWPDLMGTVTVSPSKVFTLFTNSTEQQYADAHLSADQVPAKLLPMSMRRFSKFMAPAKLRRRLGNLYYEHEYYYWSGVPPLDLGIEPEQPPLSCLVMPSRQEGQQQLFITTARLRVTARDSVHVLHYDTSPSLLVQLKGRKQVTLIPPDQMPNLYPYERGHLLFRRARVDISAPDYTKYPLARNLKPTELVMGPGDVLVFPKDTCHQTRTLTDNVNMSFRFKNSIKW